jgi:fumarate reductase subunit D
MYEFHLSDAAIRWRWCIFTWGGVAVIVAFTITIGGVLSSLWTVSADLGLLAALLVPLIGAVAVVSVLVLLLVRGAHQMSTALERVRICVENDGIRRCLPWGEDALAFCEITRVWVKESEQGQVRALVLFSGRRLFTARGFEDMARMLDVISERLPEDCLVARKRTVATTSDVAVFLLCLAIAAAMVCVVVVQPSVHATVITRPLFAVAIGAVLTVEWWKGRLSRWSWIVGMVLLVIMLIATWALYETLNSGQGT